MDSVLTAIKSNDFVVLFLFTIIWLSINLLIMKIITSSSPVMAYYTNKVVYGNLILTIWYLQTQNIVKCEKILWILNTVNFLPKPLFVSSASYLFIKNFLTSQTKEQKFRFIK